MKKIIVFILVVLTLCTLYSRFIAINNFKVHEYTIENNEIPDSFEGMNIVHFSDILIGEYTDIKKFNKVIEEINKLDPDIVFFTGDLIDNEYSISDKEKEEIINGLKSIDTTLQKFAIAGDNDLKHIDLYKTILDDSEFHYLDNKSYTLFYDENEPITITGLTDTKQIDESYKIDESLTSNYNITLIHKPDLIDEINQDVDLYLSGHSLGGYIRLPFVGSIINKNDAEKYKENYFKFENSEIYISNGIGVEKYPFRFLNTPSINFYRLNTKINE